MEQTTNGEKEARSSANAHAPDDGDFGAAMIGDVAGPGTAEESGDVLDADNKAGQGGAVA